MFRVIAHIAADKAEGVPFDRIVLAHDERRLRRKLLTLQHGDAVLVDFPNPVTLGNGDRLALEDGRTVEIVAAEELLLEVRGRDSNHLTRLAWHLGNRHLPAQIEAARILVRRDHVIRNMLLGLDAIVSDISAPFTPEHGAYHGHGEQPHALSLGG
jgi:urease accessory protein